MEKPLENKIALITGGGRGIGATTAELFAGKGAQVVITSRTEKELFKIAENLRAGFGKDRILAIPADVSDEGSVKNLFEQILGKFGELDILINNAATLEVEDFLDLKASTWDTIMAVNLRGSFLCSREAFRHMKTSGRGGAIVNLSSLGGIRGTQKFPGLSAYVVSKHGIIGLTESLAVEGKPLGIRVNCVAPGAVNTSLLKKAAPFLKTQTTTLDVAKAILFLCDAHQSRAITGAVIEIYSNE